MFFFFFYCQCRKLITCIPPQPNPVVAALWHRHYGTKYVGKKQGAEPQPWLRVIEVWSQSPIMWLLCFLCCYRGVFLSHAQEVEDDGRGTNFINTSSRKLLKMELIFVVYGITTQSKYREVVWVLNDPWWGVFVHKYDITDLILFKFFDKILSFFLFVWKYISYTKQEATKFWRIMF